MKGKFEDAIVQILEKAYEKGMRTVVHIPDITRLKVINRHLWTYKADSFLPHGMDGDDMPDEHPIWLTVGNDNPNRAEMLMICGDDAPDNADEYPLIVDIFEDSNISARSNARQRWKLYADKGREVAYWQQDINGVWQKKA